MLGLFKKKSPVEKLYAAYEKLLGESYQLSTVDRAKSDAKMAEAEKLMQEIKKLES